MTRDTDADETRSPAPATEPVGWQRVQARAASITVLVLETVGLKRRRGPDGSLLPRRWGRLALLAGSLLVGYLAVTAVHVVPAGSVAVPITFGSAGPPLEPGLHLTLPWPVETVTPFSTRTENYTMVSLATEEDGPSDDAVSVLGRDGGAAIVDSTLLYRVVAERATDVYENVGTDYVRKVIRPSARNCIRSAFTDNDLVAAATDGWRAISEDIRSCMKGKIEPVGISVEDFQLREVELSDQVQAAIDAKVSAQQEAQRQQFDLATAQQLANIARTDALATADAQQILACGTQPRPEGNADLPAPNPVEACSQAQLTPEYLQYLYILALQNLVSSPNGSTVLLPFDQNLTPLLNLTGQPDQAATGAAGTGGGPTGGP